VLAIAFGIFNICLVLKVPVLKRVDSSGNEIDEESSAIVADLSQSQLATMDGISRLIREGADTFLKTQYLAIGVFMILFSIIIVFTVEKGPGEYWVTSAFVLGAITSMVSGYIGMWISVRANVRVTKLAQTSLPNAFVMAFRGGAVLGFTLVGIGLLNLILLIQVYQNNFLIIDGKTKGRGYEEMFEAIAGYGLGGSAVALFGRVGGGIYTKAADVGADLAGKVIAGLPEDSPENPGVIADNVGDNVGDIAGMGADLFGSLAESTCACLVISGSSPELIKSAGYYFPLIISSSGIIVCIVTTFFATHIIRASNPSLVNMSLNMQLFISTVLMTPTLYWLTHNFLPSEFKLVQAGVTVS